MKRALRFFIVTLAALGVAAFVPTAASAQMKKSKALTMVTGSTTGSWFPSGAAVAELTNKQYDGQPISVVPGAGGVGNPVRVGIGKGDIGISAGPFLKAAQAGNKKLYPKNPAYPKLRSIAAGPSTAQHLTMDVGMSFDTIKTAMAKKAALRVGSGVAGSINRFSFEVLLEQFGVTFKGIQDWGGVVAKTGSTGAADAYKNRQLDIVNIFINFPNAKIADMFRARKSVLVSIPKDTREALKKEWGFLDETIPAGLYEGQDYDVQTLALPLVFFATTDVDEEMVYTMTKAFAENKARMVQVGGMWKAWDPKKVHLGLGAPIHDGAMRYFKEQGLM